MELRDAILRGCAVAAKESEGRALNCVRLVPKVLDAQGNIACSGYMMATNGEVGSFVWIHPRAEYPDIALDAGAAKKAFTAIKKGEPFTIEVRGTNAVSIESAKGQKFLVATRDVNDFPPLPAFPAQLHVVDEVLDNLRLVHHAAGADKDKPEVQCVHLTPGWSEATDCSRIARVGAPVVNAPCVVTKDVFKSWPRKGKLGTAVGETKGNVFFQVGEELRFTGKKDATEWFNLSPMLPEAHLGHRIHLGREEFKQATKLALSSTTTMWVELRIGEDKISVSGIDAEGTPQYHQTLDAFGAGELQVFMFRGKLLWDALNAMNDKVVTLCYVKPTAPVRLEGANYVEAIWPLRPVEG